MAESNELITVNLLTPERRFPSFEVSRVHVPAYNGYMEILPNHASCVVQLGMGVLSIGDQKVFINGGYIEILNNSVKVLADSVETLPGDELSETRADKVVDGERAKNSLDRANSRLASMKLDDSEDELDTQRAILAKERAERRLEFLSWSSVSK